MPAVEPSLNAIRAFTAAAEHGSFSAAARHLAVGQPCISRHVANLERTLNTKLFRRTQSASILTEEGQALFDVSSRCLAELDRTTRAIQRRSFETTRLNVDVSVAFATLWLLQRLDEFTDKHPDIDLRLITRHENSKTASEADVTIYFGEVTPDDPAPALVVPEQMVAVCGRNYALEATKPTAHELRTHRLLGLDDPAHRDDWTKLLGDRPTQTHQTYSSYTVYLQAIVEGHGIGIGWLQLIDNHLASGALRRVGDFDVRTNRGYYLTISRHARDDDAARHFADWLAT